jgi:hypothetical protein
MIRRMMMSRLPQHEIDEAMERFTTTELPPYEGNVEVVRACPRCGYTATETLTHDYACLDPNCRHVFSLSDVVFEFRYTFNAGETDTDGL